MARVVVNRSHRFVRLAVDPRAEGLPYSALLAIPFAEIKSVCADNIVARDMPLGVRLPLFRLRQQDECSFWDIRDPDEVLLFELKSSGWLAVGVPDPLRVEHEIKAALEPERSVVKVVAMSVIAALTKS